MVDYSITAFNGELNKAGGPSYKNRYQVILTIPNVVEANIMSGNELNIFCDLANFPGHRVSTADVTTTAHPIRIPYSFTTEELNFSFHLNGNYAVLDLFSSWMEKIIDSFTYELAYKKDIVAASWEVWQLNRMNEKTKGVKLYNVFPIQTDAIELSNGASNEIQKLNVVVTYDRREIIRPMIPNAVA